MFKFLYELLCGRNFDPTYVRDVYPFVGLFTVIYAAAFCLIFYLLLGRWKPVWSKLVHWVITVILLVIVAISFALTQAKGAIGANSYDSFMIKFAFVNALYAVIYFLIFSILLKRGSIFAKRTPF